MARGSGNGAGCTVVSLIVIGVISSIPKEMWAWIIGLVVVGFVTYLFSKNDDSSSSSTTSAAPAPDSSSPTNTGYRPSFQPRAKFSPSVTAESCWQPSTNRVKVAGYDIPSAGFYIGKELANVAGTDIEPALINLAAPIADSPAGMYESLGYWPSYSSISPRNRARYLAWLAGGRGDPSTDIGYVFLFFYGLERRMLNDIPTAEGLKAELPWVRSAVNRLLSIYGPASGSFRNYASNFLDFLSLSDLAKESNAYDGPAPEPSPHRRISLALKMGLGRAVGDGKPIRADWAYSWLMSDERVKLRTAATRCEKEFKELFLLRYRETYGEGMKVTPPKTMLKALYRPASSSFGHRTLEFKFNEIRDISVMEAPLQKLYNLAEQVTDQLGPYSRLLARDSAKAGTIAGLLLLPPALWPDEHLNKLGKWLSDIGADKTAQAVGFKELIRHFPTWEEMNREKVEAFSAALESLGVGMEPDVRWGGPMPEESDPVVLFPLDKAERTFEPTALYKAAALTMRLSAVVTAADGGASPEEEQHLQSQIERWPDLTALERKRLHAFMKWLLLTKPSLTGIKRLTKEMDESQKRGLATFLIHVAQAEGGVSAKELKSLEKIYRALGLNENELYSQAHSAATEPVIVRSAAPAEQRHAIPGKPAPAAPPGPAALDEKRIHALRKESEEVSKLLANIFAEPVQEQPTPEPTPEPSEPEAPSPIRNLDAEHAAFVTLLISRSQWTRAELKDLADDRHIMLDGALEKINEAALDQFNEPLFEGEDPLEINANVLKELV